MFVEQERKREYEFIMWYSLPCKVENRKQKFHSNDMLTNIYSSSTHAHFQEGGGRGTWRKEEAETDTQVGKQQMWERFREKNLVLQVQKLRLGEV